MSQEVWAEFETPPAVFYNVQALNSNKIWAQNDPVQLHFELHTNLSHILSCWLKYVAILSFTCSNVLISVRQSWFSYQFKLIHSFDLWRKHFGYPHHVSSSYTSEISVFLWITQHYNPEYLWKSEIFILYLGKESIQILI